MCPALTVKNGRMFPMHLVRFLLYEHVKCTVLGRSAPEHNTIKAT